MKTRLRIFIPFALTAMILVFFLPRSAKFNYEYAKGKPWKYETLFAQFDFPILKTAEQLDQERYFASYNAIPYYRIYDQTEQANLNRAEQMDLGQYRSEVLEAMNVIYGRGVVADQGLRVQDGQLASDVIYIQRGKRAQKVPSAEVYELSDARAAFRRMLPSSPQLDSIIAANALLDLIEPNLSFDAQTTDLINAEAVSAVSPTQGYVRVGQPIVSEGELVTAEIAQILDSYKSEYEATLGYDKPRFFLWFANILMAAGMVFILFFVIYFTKPHILTDKRLYYILLVYLIFALATLIILRLREDMLYMVPFTLAALYLHAFFRPRLILPVYMCTLLPLLIFADEGVVLFVMNMIAGAVSIYSFNFLSKGWKQFISALITFSVLLLVYVAFYLLSYTSASLPRVIMSLFTASFLSVLGYPLIYLFEKLFNLVSTSRLIELCDTSNPLIRDLEKKAPGTFQHSLQVMNMADAVARAIDANPNLVRAGALYHDIGKMNNPLCFVENESLLSKDEDKKYHSGLTPKQSAADIIRHVTDGYEMAQKNGLPEKVSDFILTHHGTSVASFFYNKFLNDGGDPADMKDFQYSGKRPVSKEQVILMLCDTVEAASRTLKDHSAESFSRFIEDIVAAKMRAGQFDEAEISISELGVVKAELKAYLAQIYHERIAYPKRKINR
ncbi:MAG: HDIG domain-containing protein [Bacteroidales bacterium]|nr:HDIG domain-containing protein [Candidatus Cryptobacteroides equifaecalis]